MVAHDVRLVFRHLFRRKIYSFVILMSLIVGFSCANLLVSFLISETSTDSFHEHKNESYQLFSNDPFADKGNLAYIPGSLYEYLRNYPEVKSVCQIGSTSGVVLETGTNEFPDLTILSVDSSFFDLFSFPIAGSLKGNCLTPNSIILTKEKSLTLFGNTEAVGKVVSFKTPDTTKLLTVSAIIENSSEKSHLVFDALIHHSILPKKREGGASYVLLAQHASSAALQNKINADPERPGLMPQMTYSFQPLVESYFNADNKMPYMRTRSHTFIQIGYVVCGLIVFMAGFNFINLFLLSWQDRKKEIGIKKTLGVTLKSLFQFSLVEASLYIVIAFSISLVFTYLFLPVFNVVTETQLSFSYLTNTKVLVAIGLVLFLSGTTVVIISVWKQWRMKPISLMQQITFKASFNKLLFTTQFIISITVAICAITIIQQMRFIKSAPLGFNRNIIQLDNPNRKIPSGMSILKDKALQIPGVNHATLCSGNPVSGNSMIRYDLGNDRFYNAYVFEGDEDLINTLDLTIVSGKLPTQGSNDKLVNEQLVKQFDMTSPVGEAIPGTTDRIAGVVKDFTCSSFKQEIPPVIITFKKNTSALLIDYSGKDLSTLIPVLAARWKEVYPDYFFRYKILQQELMRKYKEDTLFYKIVVAFSVVSMIISAFGLFALSWAVIQSRTKEMGIRKVMGASTGSILALVTRTFTARISIAFLIAAPGAYYAMSWWLARFANKIQIDALIFVQAAAMVAIIAIAAISMQALKAARTNAVQELKNN